MITACFIFNYIILSSIVHFLVGASTFCSKITAEEFYPAKTPKIFFSEKSFKTTGE